MKATTTAIELAKSAKETLSRVNVAIASATKRLAELSVDAQSKTPRIVAAVAQIQEAMRFADVTRRTVTLLAAGALSLQPQAMVELGEHELSALSYGLLPEVTDA